MERSERAGCWVAASAQKGMRGKEDCRKEKACEAERFKGDKNIKDGEVWSC